jgi:hypothetical protein
VGGWTGVIVEAAGTARLDELFQKLHAATSSQLVRQAITMRRARKVSP